MTHSQPPPESVPVMRQPEPTSTTYSTGGGSRFYIDELKESIKRRQELLTDVLFYSVLI